MQARADTGNQTHPYRHGRILSEMRVHTKGMDLVRPAATRFATALLTLRSIHKHKDPLRALFSGDVFTRSKVSKTEAGKKVYSIVFSTEFWHSVEDCLRASLPLLVVLRLVDGDEKPAMPEVAAAMKIAKQKITSSFSIQSKKACLNRIMKIVDNRWVKQMDTPLYGAALYLNPGKFYSMKQSDDEGYVGELRGCFNDVLVKMVLDEDLRDKIDAQAVLYENQREAFANPMAIKNAQTRNPREYSKSTTLIVTFSIHNFIFHHLNPTYFVISVDWWLAYGGRTIELYKFARRIVSLCASSSSCERNWSKFEFVS
jgi:hypothetical protein